MRRVVEPRLQRGPVRRVAELARADEGLDDLVRIERTDAVVVPVEHVEPTVGARGRVLREVQAHLGALDAIDAETGAPVAHEGADDAVAEAGRGLVGLAGSGEPSGA